MKAILRRRYGPAGVLTCEEIERPAVGDADVLIKVRAASVNPRDWHFTTGEPYFIRLMTGLRQPEDLRVGTDVAGEVEAIGRNVTRLKIGDHVFGWCKGAFAEYACASEAGLTLKPRNVSFEHAACVATAGLTALQGLRDKGRIQPGQQVLINGAGGGVGTFAVQIARSFGADVTGVCSTSKLDLVQSLGANQVIDYTQEDFTSSGQRYDLILDCVGTHSWFAVRRALHRNGTLVVVGGRSGRWMIGPLARAVTAPLLSKFVSQTLIMSLTRPSHDDLVSMSELLAAGTVTPIVDRLHSLIEVKEAVRLVGQGHARGKVVIVVGDLSHEHHVPGLAS